LRQGRIVAGDSKLRVYRITVQEALTLSDLSVAVYTAQAGKSVRFGLWNADGNTGKFAGTQVFDSGKIGLDTVGFKTVVDTTVLPAGEYWLGTISDGTTAAMWGVNNKTAWSGIADSLAYTIGVAYGFFESTGAYSVDSAAGDLSSETWTEIQAGAGIGGCCFVAMRFTV